jgi:hypothetical protein
MSPLRHTIHTSVTIAAEPRAVWEVLVDFAAYHEWNPFVLEAEGDARVGSVLTVRIQPPGGKAMTHRPTVIAAEPGARLRWHGRLPIPGLFDARHEFALLPQGDGTLFRHSEVFDGLLVPVLRSTLERTEHGFHAMNQAIRTRATSRR